MSVNRTGTRVKVISKQAEGVIRFVGTTEFAPGKWIGVELDAPVGKNNGSVQGKEYFQCEENHGMFVRAAQIEVLA